MVELEAEGRVAIVRLQRKPVNAINLGFVESVSAALERAAGADYDAVVVTGMPGVFSAGIDTREVPTYDGGERAAMLRGVNRMVLGFYGLEKPTVAAISGHALAGGFVLALCCDLRLAADGAFRLGITEVDAGIPFPAGPLVVLQSELSPERARRLTLGGLVDGPRSALFAGIIDRVVEPDRLREEAIAAARELAAKPGYAAVKRQLRARAIERLRAIVERDEEPLLAHWV